MKMINGLIYLATLVLVFSSCTSKNDKIDIENIDFSKNIKKLYSDINCINIYDKIADTIGKYADAKTYEVFNVNTYRYSYFSKEKPANKLKLLSYLYFEQEENPYDNSTKEEMKKMKNIKYKDSIAFFKNIYFNYIDVITNLDTLAIGMKFNTRTNQTDSTYFDREMKTLELKLGKPKNKNRIFNGYYFTLKNNTWIIKDKMYQFSEYLIAGPDLYGIQLLILEMKYIHLFDKEENTNFIYVDHRNVDL